MRLWVDVGVNNERRAVGACFMNESKPNVTAQHSCQLRRLLVVSCTVLGREKMQLDVGGTMCRHLDNQRRAFLTDHVPGDETKTLDTCGSIGSLDVAKFSRDKSAIEIFLESSACHGAPSVNEDREHTWLNSSIGHKTLTLGLMQDKLSIEQV